MLKKTITFTDYNGDERTEDFYFNYNQAEAFEKMVSEEGGLDEKIKQLMSKRDGKEIMRIFKEIILDSVGVKTADGRFKKSEEISRDFYESAAYPVLFAELVTDADAAAAFCQAIVE